METVGLAEQSGPPIYAVGGMGHGKDWRETRLIEGAGKTVVRDGLGTYAKIT